MELTQLRVDGGAGREHLVGDARPGAGQGLDRVHGGPAGGCGCDHQQLQEDQTDEEEETFSQRHSNLKQKLRLRSLGGGVYPKLK